MKVSRVVTGTILTFLLSEIVCRIALSVIFQTPFFQSEKLWQHYYPELKLAQQYDYVAGKHNLLILGGSVVYRDTLTVNIGDSAVMTYFCDLAKTLPVHSFNVLNLAEPGHNSLDSRLKYDRLKKLHFDAVFIYHGINDTRTNNVSAEAFDPMYRHIEFYDDISVLLAHKEVSYWATPFTLHWLTHSFQKKKKTYIPKELFRGLLNKDPEPFLQYGADIKSGHSFKTNLEAIITEADDKGEMVILSTYAFYQPENYDIDSFTLKKLDYDQQIYPTELYGLPANVVKGLEVHNEVIRQLHQDHPETFLIDADASIPKDGQHFNDICHINTNGCLILAGLIKDPTVWKTQLP